MKRLLFALAVLVLPAAVFAKGAVIGYAAGWVPAPTAAQLGMVTHVMVFQIVPNANGSLNNSGVPSWLSGFVSSARSRGVIVSIAVGGWTSESPSSPSYASAANSANRATFVNNLVNFVNQYNLDGIDIDWEYPEGTEGWNNFISLCGDLKSRLPGKRISAALSGATPSASNFPGNVRSGIWNALDAIHLMSYDMGSWPTHSDAGRSKQLIDAWANWGAGQPGFNKEKLVIGCAFYARNNTPGDNPASLKEKVDHCYDNGYGGVMIWELSDDLPNNTLLTAIHNANTAKGGYTGGTVTPPVAPTRFNIPGNIDACGYSAISVGQCEGTNIGYLENGSTVDYLINVTGGAGSYKIKMKTAEGNGNARTITITGGGANAAINVPAGTVNDWTTYTERQADIQLNSGSATLRISVNGAVNFKDITISKESTNPPNPPIPPAGDVPDLADGSWGDDAWSKVSDEGRNGSSVNITKQGNPLTATLIMGAEPQGDDIPDDDWPYASIGFYDGDWSNVTKITVNYSVNQPAYIALSSKNGHEYYVELETGNNRSKEIIPSQFQKFDWDGDETHSLVLSQVEGIVIAAYDTYGQTTNLTVTSLKVQGLVIESVGETPIMRHKAVSQKAVTGASASVVNGNLNLSLPSSANSANIVLFDARGRILFERSVAMSGNFVSVALPKDILRNQAAVLQVKTNSGVGLTKRILIK